MALDGTLDYGQMRHLAGNGMHLAAVGAVILFLLGSAELRAVANERVVARSPIHRQEGDDGSDDEGV